MIGDYYCFTTNTIMIKISAFCIDIMCNKCYYNIIKFNTILNINDNYKKMGRLSVFILPQEYLKQ